MKRRLLYEDMPGWEIVRRVSEIDMWSSTFMKTAPPNYDPIFTPIFASIGFSTITVAGISINTAALASAIVTTAIVTGAQLLLAQSPPKPEDGKAPKQQAVPYRMWGIGRVRVAGAFMLWESKDNKLYAVQAIAGHRIHAVNRFWLHADEVFLRSDGATTNDGKGRYGDSVQILYRLGLPTETAYAPIVDALSVDGVWTSNHRGDGQASLGMIATATNIKNQQTRYPYGIPQLSVEADMALVWDYRDSTQLATDPTTWKWSQNSALAMCWHQCFNEFGHRRDYTKAILPVLDMWIEEANICDEDVARASGGTEKRYQVNGWDTTEREPKIGTNAIMASCDGWLCERGDGALLFTVGKFRESRVAVLTDADISGRQVQGDVLPSEEINRLVPKFTYPATDYTTSDVDFFEDVPRQEAAGRVLAQDMDLGWVQQWRQARRLGKREWLRISEKVRGTLDVRLSGINCIYSRWIRLDTPVALLRLNGKLIENRRSRISLMKGGFTMDFVKHPDDIDAWTPSIDEGAQPPVPSSPNASNLDAPVIYSVVPVASSGSVYLQIQIVDYEDDSLTPTVRFQVTDVGGGVAGAWSEKVNPDAVSSGGYLNLVTDVVPADRDLNIEAAVIDSKGKYSDWSPVESIHSTVDQTPPGTPVDLQTSVVTPDVTISARAANDNTRFLVFKRGTTSQSFAAATTLSTFQATGNQVISITDTPTAGTWKYWVGALNGSNLPSASQTFATLSV